MMSTDWKEYVERLKKAVSLTKAPIAIQAVAHKDDLDAIQKLRRPKHLHMPCQLLGQAMQMGFTIGFTDDDLVGDNCSRTVGLLEQTDEWRKGEIFNGVWCGSLQDAELHHGALTPTDRRRYGALVASPLASGRITPDVCMLVGSPGQIFMVISGYLRQKFEPLTQRFVGESSCSMGWVKTLQTGEPGLAVPCFAEMRYGGFSEHEMILTLSPEDFVRSVEGLEALGKVGLRYPVPPYGMQMDVCEGVGVSYGDALKKGL